MEWNGMKMKTKIQKRIWQEMNRYHHSIEFLIGLDVRHAQLGLGKIVRVDNAQNFCIVKFELEETWVKVYYGKIVFVAQPWHVVDLEKLEKNYVDFLNHRSRRKIEISVLKKEIDRLLCYEVGLEADIEDLKYELIRKPAPVVALKLVDLTTNPGTSA